MTPEQMALFVREAQAGMAMGLEHPYEWYVNATRTLMHTTPYSEIPARERDIAEVFLAFFRGCDGMPGDPIATWTHDDMIAAIDMWYARPHPRRDY